jgi:hypothetical protein
MKTLLLDMIVLSVLVATSLAASALLCKLASKLRAAMSKESVSEKEGGEA